VVSVLEGAADEGPPYRAHSYFTWNTNHNSFDLVMFSNMGEFAQMEGRFVGDDTLAAVCTVQAMGTLCAQRTVTKFGKDGITEATNHCLFGTAEPLKSFHAIYTRRMK